MIAGSRTTYNAHGSPAYQACTRRSATAADRPCARPLVHFARQTPRSSATPETVIKGCHTVLQDARAEGAAARASVLMSGGVVRRRSPRQPGRCAHDMDLRAFTLSTTVPTMNASSRVPGFRPTRSASTSHRLTPTRILHCSILMHAVTPQPLDQQALADHARSWAQLRRTLEWPCHGARWDT